MKKNQEKGVSVPDQSENIPIPPAPKSDLLDDLVHVWGGAVGIDADTARAIILTVVGGVVGNSVRIHAPRVGEFGADLQIAVTRDKAPALRRGMQRMLEAFEHSILSRLKEYEHLTSKRAQEQEKALLESDFNMVNTELAKLQDLVEDPTQMMNITLQKQDGQVFRRVEECRRKKEELADKCSAIRFRMRPMVMVQELGVPELDDLPRHSFDNSILEIVASPGYLARLAMMRERNLDRIAAFRRNSGWSSRLEFSDGDYRRRSSISTLLLATSDELAEAWSDRMLNATGLLDEMLVCIPAEPLTLDLAREEPGGRWAMVVHRLFAKRLASGVTTYGFGEDAGKRFEEVRRDLVRMGENYQGCLALLWRETGPALVAKLALCARLVREEEGRVVEKEDLEVAIPLAMRLLEFTAMHRERVGDLSAVSQSKVAEPENPIARMVGKLRRLGPCTMRTLFRNYPVVRYDLLQPVLDRAIEMGLVVREGTLLKVAATGAGTTGGNVAA